MKVRRKGQRKGKRAGAAERVKLPEGRPPGPGRIAQGYAERARALAEGGLQADAIAPLIEGHADLLLGAWSQVRGRLGGEANPLLGYVGRELDDQWLQDMSRKDKRWAAFSENEADSVERIRADLEKWTRVVREANAAGTTFDTGTHRVDAAARRIQLIAEQHIGRTGRGAEAAMHAGAQDLVGFGDGRIGELGEREMRLHG